MSAESLIGRMMDAILEWFDSRFQKGAFGEVDRALRELNVAQFPSTLLVTLLMASSWAKARLPSRPEFVRRVRARFEYLHSPAEVEDLLRGLE